MFSVVAPIMPAQSMILVDVNMTSATLAMESWETGGCPLTSFDVDLQVMGDNVWRNVQRAISPNAVSRNEIFIFTRKGSMEKKNNLT